MLYSVTLFSQENVVFFSGNEIISDKKVNEIFKKEKINESVENLLSLYLDSGYPFAEILLDSSVKRGNMSFYYFRINENGKYFISQVKNISLVKTSFLNNSLNLKNKLFADKLIKKELSKLSVYDFIEVDFDYTVNSSSDTSVEIITNINQKKASKISGTLSSEIDSLILVGYLSLLLTSPFGFGDCYNVNYSRISYEKTDLQGNFEFPFLFSTPLGVYGNGYFLNLDSTLLVSEYSLGLFISIMNFKVKTGLGRTMIIYPLEGDSNKSYSHILGELEYREDKERYLNINVKNNLSEDFTAIFDFNSIWNLNVSYMRFLSLAESHYAFTETYEKEYGKYLGGNGNLKSYPEDFILAADYLFFEERILFASSKNIKPGVFADISVYRTIKTSNLDSYLYSYGITMQAGNETTNIDLFYGLNPNLSILQGRVHLTLSYFF